MAVSVAQWNVREGLAIPRQMPRIIEGVKRLDSDIVVLSDAFSLNNRLHGAQEATLGKANSDFMDLGYTGQDAEYDDSVQWHHDRNIVMLSRVAVSSAGEVRLGTRSALELKTAKGIHIVGAHFDDRDEETRVTQALAYVDHVQFEEAPVLIGDLNSTRALRIGSLLQRPIAEALFSRLPERVRRTADMTQGRAMTLLKASGFRDADKRHRPTVPSMVPILQLDHCMVGRNVEVRSFDVAPRLLGSDHRAIQVSLSI